MPYASEYMISFPGQARQPGRLSSVSRDPSFHLDLTNAAFRSTLGVLLNPVQSAASDSTFPRDNYHLTRINTRDSSCSEFSNQLVFGIALDLSPKEIALVRYTWNRMLVEDDPPVSSPQGTPGAMPGLPKKKVALSQLAVQALSMFCTQLYLNLLAMDPKLEEAFPLIRHQALSMAGVMSLAVASLENLLSLDSYMEQLGKRHLRILGVDPPQFEMMGEALIQTFVQRFGSKFTQELQMLWIKFYMYLANTLLMFGIDPVLRLGPPQGDGGARTYLHSQRLECGSSDLLLRLNSARRGSYSTGITEMLLVAEEKVPVAKQTLLPPMKQSLPEPKKRLRLRKKTRDCVIV